MDGGTKTKTVIGEKIRWTSKDRKYRRAIITKDLKRWEDFIGSLCTYIWVTSKYYPDPTTTFSHIKRKFQLYPKNCYLVRRLPRGCFLEHYKPLQGSIFIYCPPPYNLHFPISLLFISRTSFIIAILTATYLEWLSNLDLGRL